MAMKTTVSLFTHTNNLDDVHRWFHLGRVEYTIVVYMLSLEEDVRTRGANLEWIMG